MNKQKFSIQDMLAAQGIKTKETLNKKTAEVAIPVTNQIITNDMVTNLEGLNLMLGEIPLTEDNIDEGLRLHAQALLFKQFGLSMQVAGQSVGVLTAMGINQTTFKVVPKMPKPTPTETIVEYYHRVKSTMAYAYTRALRNALPYQTIVSALEARQEDVVTAADILQPIEDTTA